MAPDAIERIVEKAQARFLAIGTGRDAPDPRDVRLDKFPTATIDALTAEPDETFARDWAVQLDRWERPQRHQVFELVFTSGTTGTPKGVMLSHANVLSSIEAIHRIIPPIEHRIVSVLPLSHLLEQAVGLFYAVEVGADILYVRSRNPRVIFEAIRSHRTTSMILVPQVLDLFWTAIEREVDKTGKATSFRRLRGIARHLPMRARRFLFRRVHRQFGGGLRLLVSTAAFLPPIAAAGLGGPRCRRGPGVWLDRMRLRDMHDPRGSRPRDGGPVRAAGRGEARRRRRSPRPRPQRVQRLLA